MSTKKLYALTDAQAETLRALARESATTVSNYALDALTPVTVDDLGNDVIKHMAHVLFQSRYGSYYRWDEFGRMQDAYRKEARTTLAALLGAVNSSTS